MPKFSGWLKCVYIYNEILFTAWESCITRKMYAGSFCVPRCPETCEWLTSLCSAIVRFNKPGFTPGKLQNEMLSFSKQTRHGLCWKWKCYCDVLIIFASVTTNLILGKERQTRDEVIHMKCRNMPVAPLPARLADAGCVFLMTMYSFCSAGFNQALTGILIPGRILWNIMKTVNL